MEYAVVFACNEDGVIGKNNQLPWKLTQDMKFFKSLTEGNIVIMGRKTYESIGHPLPNRVNIIVTNNICYEAPGCEIAHSLEDALSMCSKGLWTNIETDEDGNTKEVNKKVFIIGGKQLIDQALPMASAVFMTTVSLPIEIDENTVVVSREFTNYMRLTINFPLDPEPNLLTPDDTTPVESRVHMYLKV